MAVEDRSHHDAMAGDRPVFATSFRSDRISAGASAALRRVSLRVSTVSAEEKIVSPRDGTSVLVQLVDTPFEAVVIQAQDRAKPASMQRAGDVCSLAAGVIAIAQEVSGGKIIRYDISRSSFRAFLDYRSVSGVTGFEVVDVTSDPALRMLSRIIQPLLTSGLPSSQKFAEYFTLTLFSHLAQHYGTNDQRMSPASGGLSPRNKRVAEETLRATLGPSMSIDELAQRCGLSTRHFARAFQQSFGMPFHRFQLDLKLQHAKRLLAESTASIKDIAIEMGYADQATFTESFTRTTGMPPGRYRRRHTSQGGVVAD
jgi:AraC-like DNA-binding protein